MKAQAAKARKVDPEEYQRFLDAAHELGCEENFERFDEALKAVAKAKPKPRAHSRPVSARTKRERD